MPVLQSRDLGSEWGSIYVPSLSWLVAEPGLKSRPDPTPEHSAALRAGTRRLVAGIWGVQPGRWGGCHPACPISCSRTSLFQCWLWVVCLLRGSCAAPQNLSEPTWG